MGNYFVRWVKHVAGRLAKNDVTYDIDNEGYLCIGAQRAVVQDTEPFTRPKGVYALVPVKPELSPEPAPEPVLVVRAPAPVVPIPKPEPAPEPVPVVAIPDDLPAEPQPVTPPRRRNRTPSAAPSHVDGDDTGGNEG